MVSKHLIDDAIEPHTVGKALKQEQWRKAMAEEFNALMANETWKLVEPSPKKNVVGNKWVFTVKRKLDGSIERLKARTMAKEFH